MAVTDKDFDIARGLCREWLDWHWNAFPEDGPRDGNPMDPEAFQQIIKDLPRIHARPDGAILLAEVDAKPAGCVMYRAQEPGVAEIFRLFVNDAGRGHGIGRLLLEEMFTAMIADGYHTVRFSSARFLTHARRLYESAGFHDIPHPDGFPQDWRDFVYFMERPLT
jgi:GNAT superfamily N-acetyltransferase